MILDGLMDHQKTGARWLVDNPNGMLAWEMGVGKTATAVRAWENTAERGPALILCLASARENWRRETIRFAMDPDLPPRVQVLANPNDPIDPLANVVVTNYEKLLNPKVVRKLRTRGPWGALIADEAHRLKTPDAQITRLVYGSDVARAGSSKQTPLVRLAHRFWPLTGTPIPNHPGEIWSHARWLWPEAIEYHPGRPMEYWEFEARYCQVKQTPYGAQVVGGQNLAELRLRLNPYVNRLKRLDVLNLPPLRIDTWPLDTETTGGGPVNAANVKIVNELLPKLSHYGSQIETWDNVTVDAYLECIQSNGEQLASIRRETGTLKAIAGAILLREELEAGAPKTVVFAHHRDAIETIAKGLGAFNPAVLHGGTPAAKRDEEIDRFQTDPGCRVFVGQIKAAGASINLQAAERVVFVEASWSPADNDQALSRVYRAGQTKPVLVRFTYLKGSVDEAVNRALARKAAIIARVID
jgi:SWI/SNF-related matrix-associated actin-dependent regulator 1 of chromatin subfamily A